MILHQVTEVCRLCSKNEYLQNVFDVSLGDNEDFVKLVYVAVGIEIKSSDFISTKICKKCVLVVKTIRKFQQIALKNDAILKDKYKQLQQTCDSVLPTKTNSSKKGTSSVCIHPTARQIFFKYPNIKLPSICLNRNILPQVVLPLNEVEEYFIKNNLTLNIAMKCTIPHPSPKLNDTVKSKKENTEVNNSLSKKIVKKENASEKKSFSCCLNGFKRKRTPKLCVRPPKIKPDVSTLIKSESKYEDLMQLSYVEKTLQICDICNSVQYSLAALKRHRFKHLQCQFCKYKFKSVERKNEHIKKDCNIKQMMNPLVVKLEKIEANFDIRRKYPDAFVRFPPLQPFVNQECREGCETNSESKTVAKKSRRSEKFTNADKENSSAECLNKITNNSKGKSASTDSRNIDNCDKVMEKCYFNNKDTSAKHDMTDSASDIIELLSEEESNDRNPTDTDNDVTFVSNFPHTIISSKIKPDILISNTDLLNTIDGKATEITIVKDLLKRFGNVQHFKDSAIQTELPSVETIDESTILKNIKRFLHVSKIPIEYKPGNTLKIYLDYFPKQNKDKRLFKWEHITAIDLKTSGNKSEKVENIYNQESPSSNHSTTPYMASSNIPVPEHPSQNIIFSLLPNSSYNSLNMIPNINNIVSSKSTVT